MIGFEQFDKGRIIRRIKCFIEYMGASNFSVASLAIM
jgi:hypothetical protein